MAQNKRTQATYCPLNRESDVTDARRIVTGESSGQPDRRSPEEEAALEILGAIRVLAEGVREDVPRDGAARDVLILTRAYRELTAYWASV